MRVTQEVVDFVKSVFPNVPVHTESNGYDDQRILVDSFMSLEPTTVECDSLLGVRNIPGWLVLQDNGEENEWVSEEVSLCSAVTALAQKHAEWRVRYLYERLDPCLVPTTRE